MRYLCDWPNDDHPYRMKVPGGEMYSLPVLLDLDDFHMLWTRILPVMDYTRALQDSFDRLYAEGESNGRLMVLNLHTWLIGQPFRSKYLDQALFLHRRPPTGMESHRLPDHRLVRLQRLTAHTLPFGYAQGKL